jgi:uncharacterized membrane protein YeaQ/YmgE (transglycosylase-associated protein family)
MTLASILILLVIAGVCGAMGQVIAGFNLGGALVSVAVGFIGALFGVWLAELLDLPELYSLRIGDHSFPLLWSIIGSALFVALIGSIAKKNYA